MIKYHEDHEEQMSGGGKYNDSLIHLVKTRSIFLCEAFSKNTSSDLTALLLHYDHESTTDDITIYINSPGGDAHALSSIYDVIQMIEAPVKTVCLAKAYSAGGVLLTVGSKGKRYIMKNAQVMIHGIQCAFPILGDDVTTSKNYYEYLEDNNDNIMKIMAKHTGHTLEKLKDDCKGELWLDAKGALEYGIVDHIIG